MSAIAECIVRHRRRFFLGWILVALALLPLAPRMASTLEVGVAAMGESEAAEVDRLLAERFASPFSSYALLVIENVPPPTEPAGRESLREIAEAVEAVPGVLRAMSYLDVRNADFVHDNGTLLLAGLSTDGRTDQRIVALRETTAGLESKLRSQYPSARLLWTGGAAFDYDVRRTGSEDAAAAEARVLPLTLVILAVVFGSVAAALLPVGIGGLAIGLTFGAAVLLGPHWPLTVLLQSIVSMLGLGLGIDYGLLVVTRFREARAAGAGDERAAAEAARHAGHTVILSGGSVAIGFAALLLVPITELRSIATGGLLVVVFSVLLATTLLPGLLASLGGRVELGRRRRAPLADASDRRWRAWGRFVTMHPLVVLLAAGIPLAALAWQAHRLSTAIPSGDWLPERMESTQGARALQRFGKSGIVQTLRVVVELPEGHDAATDEGWQAVVQTGRALQSDPRVARVRSLPIALKRERIGAEELALVPPDIRNPYLSEDRRLALIEAVPREDETLGSLMRFTRALRATDAAALSGLPGTRMRVGGLPALNADYQDAVAGNVFSVIALVVAGTFAALLAGFRSLLVALKAVVLNLLSVAAAVGMLVLVFQDGHGARWFGLAAPLDGLFPAVPIIVFSIVFGLSMDYEVFLVSRVAECARAGMPDREALVEGLGRTGRLITSAAAIMVTVFAGFSLGDFVVIKILGFTMAVAVLIDATLVRLAVGPALLHLGGRWNWWPGFAARPELEWR